MCTTQFCKLCVNNDSIINNITFDSTGKCHFCTDFAQKNISYSPGIDSLLLHTTQNKSLSRFDALVLYTGGKDSSFLLWYLSKKLGFRILACMINLPFFQESAIHNARKAIRCLSNVELVERSICWDDAKDIIKVSLLNNGTPCLCVFLAYWFFYPLAVQENIPFFIDGVGKAQLLSYYDIKKGSGLTENRIKNDRNATNAELLIHWRTVNKFLKSNPNSAFRHQFAMFQSHVEEGKSDGPIIQHLGDMNINYTWNEIVETIKNELQWELPYTNQKTYLHTNCKLEKVKDYCQLKLFQNNRTNKIPQSISEISLSIRLGEISREQGLRELADRGYYEEPAELRELISTLNISREEYLNSKALKYILNYE